MTVTIRQGDRMVAVTGPSSALGSLLGAGEPETTAVLGQPGRQ